MFAHRCFAFVVLPVGLMVGCGPAVSTSDESIETNSGSREDIVGGTTTSAFPAAGALTRYGSAHCTGTLIGPRKVLTAAHCLEGVSASSLKFVIGPSISSAESVLAVSAVAVHPAYDAANIENDIGYVTLAQDAPIAPMKTLASMNASWVGTDLTFVGYGITGSNGAGVGVKRSVVIPISQVGSTYFSYQTPGKNTCNGDSGGPAFAHVGSEWYVAGVTSYGDQGCTQYGVDTRVDAFTSFFADEGGGGSGGSGGSGGAGGSGGSAGGGTGGGGNTDPCQGETYEGRCDGSTVVWCENQSVQKQTCSGGKVCGFAADKGYYACVSADPCKGETYEGRCDGNTVIWCENQQIKQISCSQCGFDSAKGYYNCM